MDDNASDIQSIQALIRRQFASMTWSTGHGPDVHSFEDDFVSGASLYPSARPVKVQSIAEFGERISKLSQTSLRSFHERAIGTKVQIFGNVAVAAVACENTENESNVSRNVEMMLLVKDGGCWKIAAQGWDGETADRKIPSDFLSDV